MLDHGGELAKYTDWRQKLGMQTSVCDPYASLQKSGTRGYKRADSEETWHAKPKNKFVRGHSQNGVAKDMHTGKTNVRDPNKMGAVS